MRSAFVLGGAALAAAAALAAESAARPAGEPTLVAGRPLELRLDGASPAAAVGLSLAAGEFACVTAEPGGVDLVVVVVTPGGDEWLRVDDRASLAGVESACWVAEVAGEYRVVLRRSGTGAGAPPDRPSRLELDGPRPPAEADRARAHGERLLSEARALVATPSADTLARAVAALEQALDAWTLAGEARKRGTTLRELGTAAVSLGDLERGLSRLGEALEVAVDVGDAGLQASVLGALTEALFAQGRLEAALARGEEALAAWRGIGDANGEAEALTNLGVLRGELGDRAASRASYERALEIFRELGNRRSEAAALSNLATEYVRASELDRALELLAAALPVRRELGDRPGEAAVLTNLGVVYTTLGEQSRALAYLEPALEIWRELGNRRAEAVTWNNIGYAYLAGDEPKRAQEALRHAVELGREVGDLAGAANNLVNLATAYHEAGEPAPALAAAREAREAARAVGDRRVEAATHVLESVLLTNAGELARAREHALAGLELRRGEPYMEAYALYQLARVDRAEGDLEGARRGAEQALAIFESVRGGVSAVDLRATFLASVREVYEFEIDLLMRLDLLQPGRGYDEQALLAAERARARTLLELLSESRAEIRAGVDPELVARERALRERLGAAQEARLRATPAGAADAAAASAAVDAERELRETARAVEIVEAEIRSRSPRYAELTQLGPRSLADVQRLLGTDALLLEYLLGEEASFLWAVDSQRLSTHRLPPRAEIEALARRAYASLAERAPDAGNATAALSEMLLGPVADRLGDRTVVVVADGVLHYVPFAALSDPAGGPVVARHEIVALPSAGLLEPLRGGRAGRAERAERAGRPEPSHTLAVFADPVFAPDDERLGRPGGAAAVGAAPAGSVLGRAAEDLGPGGAMPRLPFTRREALALQALVPAAESRVALDFDASRAAVLDPGLAAYRYVHFATHGLIDDQHPELSGLVFSLVDRDGRPQPGYLTAAEIFNLRLSAELVVLSGCRTGLGREVRGEGLVGLTRGFLYAGADRVVASLWKVDDAATAALMTAFYRQMLGASRRRPAAALRAAQLELAREPRFAHPYFWAGFQLVGEWR